MVHLTKYSLLGLVLFFLFVVSLVLTSCGDEDSEAILRKLHSPNQVTVVNTLDSLQSKISQNVILKMVKKGLGSTSSFYTKALSAVLGVDCPILATELRALAEGQENAVKIRCRALDLLGYLSCVPQETFCNHLLQDQDSQVVEHTIFAIARIKSTSCLQEVSQLLESPKYVSLAIWCLGEMQASDYASEIVPFLTSQDTTIQFLAQRALEKMER